jgi:hypothetical protein
VVVGLALLELGVPVFVTVAVGEDGSVDELALVLSKGDMTCASISDCYESEAIRMENSPGQAHASVHCSC